MKTFLELIKEQDLTPIELSILTESIQTEWTDELEEKVDTALEEFAKEYQNEDGSYNIERFNNEMTNEGIFGSIIGGLTGAALGKTIGKTIAKVLGIEKGVFYNMLTSRLVGAALGAAIGKSI
tara:strand:+ start:27944 stop:28312 length:369 start_codon:yes stop_codon:yes gene_type:complete